MWGGTGKATKDRDEAASVVSETGAAKLFTKIPGRPLKGRWGSIDSIEGIVGAAASYIGRVFSAVLGSVVANPLPKTKAGVGADEDKEYQQTQRHYKTTALTLASSSSCLAAVQISYLTKAPLIRFLCWGQKSIK